MYTHTYIHAHICVHVYKYIQIYIYGYINTHIYTYTDLTDKTKHSFYQAAVMSILLYGCTTWTLT